MDEDVRDACQTIRHALQKAHEALDASQALHAVRLALHSHAQRHAHRAASGAEEHVRAQAARETTQEYSALELAHRTACAEAQQRLTQATHALMDIEHAIEDLVQERTLLHAQVAAAAHGGPGAAQGGGPGEGARDVAQESL